MPIDISSDKLRNAVSNIQLRAEHDTIKQIVSTFVDCDLVARIKKKQSQIVIGRRGTGKSHLILYCYESLKNNFADFKIIPLYINIETLFIDFKSSKLPSEDLATYLFNNLLVSISKGIFYFYQKSLSEKLRFFDFAEKKKKRKLELALHRIELIATFGAPLFTKSQLEKRVKHSLKKADSAQISFSSTIDPTLITAGLKLSDDIVRETSLEDEVVRISSGINVLRASSIIELLDDILETIDAEGLYLFIDQWSDAINMDIQPYFADLVKHILLCHPKIRIKIATMPGRTNIYDPSANMGLEPDNDIFIGVDLDEELPIELDENVGVNFYCSIIRRHLGVFYPSILGFPKDDNHRFINLLFDNLESFKELIVASGGIVRDFLLLFSHAFSGLTNGTNKKIGMDEIYEASKDYFIKYKLRFMKSDRRLLKLYSTLLDLVVRKNKYPSFLIPFVRDSKEIVDLEMARLIHRVPTRLLVPQVAGKFKVYLLDHAIRVMNDMLFSDFGDLKLNTFQVLDDKVPDLIKMRTIDTGSFTVSFSIPAGEVICSKCGKTFSKNSKLYRNYGICPKCNYIVDKIRYQSNTPK